jgi:predicted transporter
MLKKDPLKIQSHFILGFLILEYLFGMFVSLFIEFPDTKNEKMLWEFAKGQPSIVIHMVLAALLVIGGIVLLIRSIRRKDRNWIIAASVGLFALLAASVAGSQFIPTQQDPYSYSMAVAFLLALFSYGWGIYKAKK